MNSRGEFHSNVFINCPFDDDYTQLLRPLLFSAVRAGLTVRIASETFDSGVARINRICKLIRESKYSVHDLSRLRASFKGEIHRMNMPFELGLDIGCRVFSRGIQSQKRCLILETEQYEYQKALSDLSNSDIKRHLNKPEEVVRQVRNWFVEVEVGKLPSATVMWKEFNAFTANFYHEREAEGFRDKDLEMMPVPEYVGYIKDWLG
ncbi:MAG: hypothetical protein OXU79_16325 [Gemmatimonadota bacterium]|nr:hypothetical protein [Gemmatimonadota bacterium]